MSAEGWIYSVAVLCAVQVLVLWRDTPDLRLAAISRNTGRNIAGKGTNTSGRPGKPHGRQDIADIISELISLVKNGSSLVEACEEAGGSSFAVPQITPSRIFTMLRRRCSGSQPYCARVSFQLSSACELSAVLGCAAAKCLESVSADHKRFTAVEDRKHSALAVPRMTLKILLALPALILLGAQVSGSQPFAVLFTTPVGWTCLASAGVFYGIGAVWVKSLIRHFQKESVEYLT